MFLRKIWSETEEIRAHSELILNHKKHSADSNQYWKSLPFSLGFKHPCLDWERGLIVLEISGLLHIGDVPCQGVRHSNTIIGVPVAHAQQVTGLSAMRRRCKSCSASAARMTSSPQSRVCWPYSRVERLSTF